MKCAVFILCQFDHKNILQKKRLVKSLNYEKRSIYSIYCIFYVASVENDRVCQIQYEKDYEILSESICLWGRFLCPLSHYSA